MTILSGVILGGIYLSLSALYIRYVWREPEEEEPEFTYTNNLHEHITSLAETDAEIQLITDMLINLNTADCPVEGDALRSMEVCWDWGGKLDQNASIPVGKGTATAEAMRNLAEIRRDELIRKLYREMAALPFPEKSGDS